MHNIYSNIGAVTHFFLLINDSCYELTLTRHSFVATYISRGNHESKSMNQIYGFEGEVKFKLSETFMELVRFS